MPMWIKICGVTRVEDAELAVQLGVDAIGFVMHAPSVRCCDVDAARAMIQDLPVSIASVGVWFDEPASFIAHMAERIGCKSIQTYDPLTARELKKIGFQVLPALAMPVDFASLHSIAYSESVLFDAGRKSANFPEDDLGNEHSRNVLTSWLQVRQSEFLQCTKLVLAGGLNSDNLREMLGQYRPDGVDVASGIESAPGVKDHKKMVQFLEEVRKWSKTASLAPTAVDSYPKR